MRRNKDHGQLLADMRSELPNSDLAVLVLQQGMYPFGGAIALLSHAPTNSNGVSRRMEYQRKGAFSVKDALEHPSGKTQEVARDRLVKASLLITDVAQYNLSKSSAELKDGVRYIVACTTPDLQVALVSWNPLKDSIVGLVIRGLEELIWPNVDLDGT